MTRPAGCEVDPGPLVRTMYYAEPDDVADEMLRWLEGANRINPRAVAHALRIIADRIDP